MAAGSAAPAGALPAAMMGHSEGVKDPGGARAVREFSVGKSIQTVLLLPAGAGRARRHVIYFPGDLQMRRREMEEDLRGGSFEYKAYSLDDTLERLHTLSGGDAHVWCVRPLRMVYQFASFSQFVRVSLLGEAKYDAQRAQATQALVAALDDATAQAAAEGVIDSADRSLPLTLVGFSKGVTVVNQLFTELGGRHEDTVRLLGRCEAVHLVDGGNGMSRGAFVHGENVIKALAALSSSQGGLQVVVHSSPYQMRSKKSPWIATERAAFLDGLEAQGAQAVVREYFVDEPPSITRHFDVLTELQLSWPTRDSET